MCLIRLCVCAGWSEHLLVAHTTLLVISCRGSYGPVHTILILIADAQNPLMLTCPGFVVCVCFFFFFFLGGGGKPGARGMNLVYPYFVHGRQMH